MDKEELEVFGYGVPSIGLLYYSLDAEKINASCQRREVIKEGQIENVPSRRKFTNKKIVLFMIGGVAVAGGIGGAIAGYNMEWDPRPYRYSATGFSD